MKNKDALERRHKYGRRQPRGNAVLSDTDIPILAALLRHGMLPSNYLLEFAPHTSIKTVGVRLTKLRHELGLVRLVERQEESGYRLSQHLTYQLTKAGTAVLAERDITHTYAQTPNGWQTHALMTACATASIELSTKKHGHTFIDQETILQDERCTHKQLSLPVGKTTLIPDQLFGVRYGEKVRFFALEADRASEDTTRIDTKLSKYEDVYRHQTYKLWGIPNLTMLYFTTGPKRAKNFLAKARDKQYLAAHHPYFISWRVPPVMYELFENPWQSPTGEFRIDRP